ncbi:MAG: D-2-hydroxyacid dehydrogenase [Paenibacillaceae bacterium]|nr:D-2-hydroxyacid dehydrogenase [Paenibacillaceae bacterium]
METLVVLQELPDTLLERIAEAAPHWQVHAALTPEDRLRRLPDAEIVFGWHADAADLTLRPGTKLRWIQCWGAGVDKFPLEELARLGIVLTHTSGIHAYPISEVIVMMMLVLTKRFQLTLRDQQQRKWRPDWQPELHGKTIGIVGVGEIGQETAKIAQAFGMTVLGVRRSAAPLPHIDRMYAMDDLDRVLGESDFVVVTLPLTPDTYRIMNRSRFAAMKRDACYINVGRGRTTDEQALIEALQSGTIAGAALDVFETEPLPADSPLWTMDNVLVSPHQSGASRHYADRAVDLFVRNLRDYAQGRPPAINCTDWRKRY